MLDSNIPTLLALAGPPQDGQPNPFGSLVMMGLIFAIFYFVLIMPMRSKQKKLEQLVSKLQAGDKIVINPGILGTVVGVEDEVLVVRVDDKTRLRVMRSAVAGLQGEADSESRK